MSRLERPMRTKNATRLLASDDICLITQPQIAKILGRSEATFLQQLHYWLTTESRVGVIIDEQRWIYNSYKSWANIIGMSESTVRRIISKLEKLEILWSDNLNKKKYDQTKWYSINYEALKSILPTISLGNIKKPSESEAEKGRVSFKNEQKHVLKMNKPSVQNEHIIKEETEAHTDTTSLKPIQTKFITPSLEKNNSIFEKEEINTDSPGIKDRDIPVHMLEIWNQVVEQGKKVCSLSKHRARYLLTALRSKFDNSLERWKAFCEHITSSQFLMGEKSTFKASLDWVLKFETMQRILEGDFGIGQPFTYKPSTVSETEAGMEAEIEGTQEDQQTKHLRLKLLKHFGKDVYRAWFKEMGIRFDQERILLQAKSRFIKDWIDSRFLNIIQELCCYWIPNSFVVME